MNMLSALLNTVAGATEVSSDSLTTWVVGAVMTTLMGVLAFLLRNAFGKVESSIERVDAKLDKVLAAQSAHDTARAVADTRLAQMEKELVEMKRKHDAELAELKRELRELSEGMVR